MVHILHVCTANTNGYCIDFNGIRTALDFQGAYLAVHGEKGKIHLTHGCDCQPATFILSINSTMHFINIHNRDLFNVIKQSEFLRNCSSLTNVAELFVTDLRYILDKC